MLLGTPTQRIEGEGLIHLVACATSAPQRPSSTVGREGLLIYETGEVSPGILIPSRYADADIGKTTVIVLLAGDRKVILTYA